MDIERTMEFIVENLARASARLDEITVKQNKLTEVQVLQAGVLEEHENRLDRITEILRELAEIQRRTEEELREAGRHTDERLNALIKVVDELIRRDGRRRPRKKR